MDDTKRNATNLFLNPLSVGSTFGLSKGDREWANKEKIGVSAIEDDDRVKSEQETIKKDG